MHVHHAGARRRLLNAAALLGAVLLPIAAAGAALLVSNRGAAASPTPPIHDMAGMAMPSSRTMEGTSYWRRVGGSAFSSDGTTRTYYIGADLVVWNYAPQGRNLITGKPFDPPRTPM